MLSATSSEKGSWIIKWKVQSNEVKKNKVNDRSVYTSLKYFKCGNHKSTYSLVVNGENAARGPTISLSLGIREKGKVQSILQNAFYFLRIFVGNVDVPNEDRPRSIAASFSGSLVSMSRQGERWVKKWNCPNVDHLSSFLRHNTTFQILLNLPCPGEENILKHLSTLLENKHMADVQFVVKGHEIGAHMLIISCNAVMAAMLDPEKFQEGQTKRVFIDDIEPETFRLLLGYLYTGKFPDVEDALKIEQLLSAAEMYQIEGLKERCEEYLKPRVTLGNVIRLLVVAHLYLAPKLMETCLCYLSDFSKQIWPRPEWKELVKIYPDLFFVASQRMSKQ